MSEGEETIGSIIRGAIDNYTREVLRDPEFLEKIKEILRDSERQKEMGRLVVLLEYTASRIIRITLNSAR